MQNQPIFLASNRTNRMSETEKQKREPRWYDRGIGAICGGLLGFFLAALVISIVGYIVVISGLVVIAGCMAVGISIGYFFPPVTGSSYWLLALFG